MGSAPAGWEFHCSWFSISTHQPRVTEVHTLTCCLSAASIPYEPSMNHWTTHTLTKILTFFPHPLSILLFPLFLSGLKSRKFPTSNMYMDDPFQQLCGGIHSQPIYSNSSILEHMVRSSRGILKDQWRMKCMWPM